jgi:hypothetical protein
MLRTCWNDFATTRNTTLRLRWRTGCVAVEAKNGVVAPDFGFGSWL